TNLAQQYGDILQFPLLNRSVYFLNHPEYLKYMLQEHSQNYDRDMPLVSIARLIVGNGLSTNLDYEDWRRQRRLLAPLFHKRSVAAFTSLMTSEVTAMLERWEGLAEEEKPLDIAHEMQEITLQIVSKAIFEHDFTQQAEVFIQSFHEAHQFLSDYLRLPFPPLSVPLPRHRRFRSAMQRLDTIVYDLIHLRREQKSQGNDLLSMLLNAVDEETGKGMSDQQIHDEVITFLSAGHETTANTLTWMWYLLAKNPEVEQRLYTELDEILAGASPTVEHLARLPYARMVVDESLRLYPAIWLLMRNALQDDTIGGYTIPAKTWIFFSPYLLHRNPAFWERPDTFAPERFAPDRLAQIPRGSYLPFGYGPHQCIGQAFALHEMVLLLAMVAQRYHLSVVPGHQGEPLPLISLHMRGGLPMYVHRR
ncbi:MAG TPA: cytochrome P450, partial [Ktedonobacteraceae bacterium]|nr:cytochrome P450 [Ktedonobacteraceae bacterium]